MTVALINHQSNFPSGVQKSLVSYAESRNGMKFYGFHPT